MLQVWFLQLRKHDGTTSRMASEYRTREQASAAATAGMKRWKSVATISIGHGDSLWRTV